MKRNVTHSLKRSLMSIVALVAMMMVSQSAMAEYVQLTALSGTGGTGSEGYASLVDGKVGTKMGHSFDPTNPDRKDAYIIVKAAKAVVPENYFLVTGGDTGSYPTRNWEDWTIYAANFASDAEATRESSAWVVVDEKVGETLPQANCEAVDYNFSVSTTTAYQYYRIEITQSAAHADIWLQMSEWGLGFYGDFQAWVTEESNRETGLDEAVKLSILDGTKNNSDGEGLPMLFDGTSSTKWGNGFTNREEGSTTNGAFFIVKASRSMCPSYYRLTTANDTQSSPGRNWKQWQVYGMNATSDADVTRTSDKWVALDKRYNVGTDQLPAANYTDAYFTMTESNTTEYRYFKVEIDEIVSNGEYMQMAEFVMGDQYTVAIERDAAIASAKASVDLNGAAPKALYDAYEALLQEMAGVTDPSVLATYISEISSQTTSINEGLAAYAELTTAYNQAMNALKDGSLDATGTAYMTEWTKSDAVAPNDTYPCGNYAYVLANRQLSTAEAKTEATRISTYLINHAATVDPAITTTYTFISGTTDNWNDAEGPASLVDGQSGLNGTESTKWGTATSGDRFVIFKADDGKIKPTYYGLVTGGDTYSYPDRNWKNWKIYAANFASDEEATKDADAWVLIDNKQNIGSDVLKTTNCFESYLYLSEGCSEAYQYFKIEVEHSGGMQMNEFTFYNQGNFNEYRESFVDQFKDYNPTESVCYKDLVEQYNTAYNTLQNTVSASELMTTKNAMVDLQDQIAASQALYLQYDSVYKEMDTNLFAEYEQASAWADGYSDDNIGPNETYIRGTHAYIMEGNLNDDDLDDEIEYLSNMIRASQDPANAYVLLGGHTVGQWGDGYYGNLIDDYAMNYTDEDGNEVSATKWGGAPDADGNTYIIFRTLGATNPFFYTLTTGNDTGKFTGRNWGTWYIYGANFAGDTDAVKDADWVLIDAKENIGQDRLHPESSTQSYFGFSTETTTPYMYYKVVVTRAYDGGGAIQMNDLHFGTEEEFDAIKAQYTAAASEFDTGVIAEQALIDEYEDNIGDIEDCMNMEALFRVNYTLESQREAILTSAANYEKYQNAVATTAEYLTSTPLEASDALEALNTYMNETVEPSETYPNGSSKYIMETHLLNDSTILAEIDYLTSLQAAAVAKGYGAGADLTSMVANPKFAKGSEGWSGTEAYGHDSFDEINMSAAEYKGDQSTFDVYQTLSGLKDGLYEVRISGAIRPADDTISYNHTAMLYANQERVFLKTDRMDMIPVDEVEDGVNWDVNTSRAINELDGDVATKVGYVLWGLKSCSYAFAAGRYDNSIVAQVNDGTLTFGVKNDGTVPGGDWTGLGNVRVRYLGTDASTDAAKEALDRAVANQEAIVAAMELYNDTEARDSVTTETGYKKAPYANVADVAAIKANLQGDDKMAAISANSALYTDIYDCKLAYVDAIAAALQVQEKWESHAKGDVSTALMESIADVIDGCSGLYSTAEADQAAANIYAKYPSYFELDTTRKGNATFTESETDPFCYDVAVDGKNPYITIIKGMYEPLYADQTVLTFEYKLDNKMEGGQFYYATPNYTTESKEAYGDLEAAGEWTRAYVNVYNGIYNWNWGQSTGHSIRWQLSTNATCNFSIRNITVITEEQMKAMGGSTINAINGIAADTEAKGIYTLSGVRVQKAAQKGIYIMDGRKVMVK